MKKLNQNGFTLIELMIYMALLSMLLLIIVQIFSSVLSVRNESQAQNAVSNDSKYILSRLEYDIARASSITIPASPGATDSSLQLIIDGAPYSYALSGVNLNINDSLSTDALNSSETQISGISFTRRGNSGGKNTISLQFTVNSVAQDKSGPVSKTIQTSIGLR